jgi:hypothetical protein
LPIFTATMMGRSKAAVAFGNKLNLASCIVNASNTSSAAAMQWHRHCHLCHIAVLLTSTPYCTPIRVYGTAVSKVQTAAVYVSNCYVLGELQRTQPASRLA